MPRVRLDGGFIGITNNPTTSVAGGVWALPEQTKYQRSAVWPAASPLASQVSATALIIAGGGGGGGFNATINGGGGGAGGYYAISGFNIFTGVNYTATVGAGGAGGASGASATIGTNGSVSSFIGGAVSYSTLGGGGGGYNTAGAAGGSGGGGGGNNTNLAGGNSTQNSTYGYGDGFAGGAGSAANQNSGGGGGAGTSGVTGGAGASQSGKGGDGLNNNITGTLTTYGGGGGGGAGGTAGAGGGAAGGSGATQAPSGANNTGGGGGGSSTTNFSAGRGGSGIVIISYPLPQNWTGGTVTNVEGTNVVHTFTSSSSLTSLSTPIDTYFPYNALLLHADGINNANNNAFIDSSTINSSLVRSGNTTQGTFSPFSTNGWSNYYATTASYLTYSDSSAGVFGTSNFTVECWIYPTTTAHNLLSPLVSTNTWGFITFGSVLYWQYNGSNFTSGGTIPANRWSHVAAVKSSSVLTLYVNGIGVTSIADTNNYSGAPTRTIGSNGGTSGPLHMSNVRIVKGSAVYTSNFIPPISALTNITNTTLLTAQSNRFIDNASTPNTLTLVGTPEIAPYSPFSPTAVYSSSTVGGSIYLNGTTDYVTVPYSSNIDLGTGDFTLEAWVYLTSAPSAGTPILGSLTTGGMNWNWRDSTHLALANNAVGYLANSGTATFSNSSWNHVATSRSSGTTYFWLNGVSIGSQIDNYTYSAASNPLYVGRSSDGYFPGYISNLRVIKGTNLYTVPFTPSTTPLSSITNTVLLLNASNAGVVDSSQKNALTTYGTNNISSSQSKFGGTSMYFDGSSNYITSPSSQQYNLGSADFTIEMWIYPTSVATEQILINKVATASVVGAFDIRMTTTGQIRTLVSQSAGVSWTNDSTSTLTVNFNQWNHIAFVRSGSTFTRYINGVNAGSFTSAITLVYESGATLNIGANGNGTSKFFGYIDEVRITRGVTRYNTNNTATNINLRTSVFLDQ